MNALETKSIIFRYLVIIVVSLVGIELIYWIFTPLTVESVYAIVRSLYGAVRLSPTIFAFKGYVASIIPACVAGAAYYLLFVLLMTTPMPLKKRVQALVFLWGSFLILNIARITLFSILLFKGYQYFDLTHRLTWYIGSTIMVVGLWFVAVKIFAIKGIPGYSDVSVLLAEARGK